MSLDAQIEQIVERVVRRVLAEKPANDTDYLSTAEAATLARVTPGTIRRWVKSGELTRHVAGARVLVKRDELEQLLRCEVVPIDSKLSLEERARRRFG